MDTDRLMVFPLKFVLVGFLLAVADFGIKSTMSSTTMSSSTSSTTVSITPAASTVSSTTTSSSTSSTTVSIKPETTTITPTTEAANTTTTTTTINTTSPVSTTNSGNVSAITTPSPTPPNATTTAETTTTTHISTQTSSNAVTTQLSTSGGVASNLTSAIEPGTTTPFNGSLGSSSISSLSVTTSSGTIASTASMTISSTTKGPNHVPVIVGVVVGVGGGLIVIAIIILLILLRRRTWQRKDEGLRPVPDKRPERHDSDMDSLHPFNPLPDRPVPIPELLQYVADHQGNMTRYKDEFERLPGPNIGLRKAAKDSANKDKNRYLNIKPYDDNRVQLFTHEEGNGYINASFIDGKKRQKAFIASQGPQEATVADFWLMVWEQKCTKIVMVTNVMEGFKVKCTQYWPKDTRTIQTFGKFKISLVSEMVDYDYTVRKLSIQKAGEPERTLTHYHFTEWPDHAVPETCTSLLKFHNAIFSDMSASDQPVAPIIVHCSAGVGRSGTLISVNFLLQQAAETSQIDIFKCIETLRLQRMYMVQTVAQYIYIHHVMLEALLLGDVTCPASNFADEYQRLSQPVTPHTKSLIQLQFDVLEALKPNYSTDLYAIARSTENASRNRSLDVLPVEPHMVCLRPTLEDKNTYINAVRVNGYHRKEPPYIVTQMPLASTASDFWRLAQDNSCVAIIMLNDLDNNNSSEQYWPADGQSVVVGKFTVTNIGPEISSNNILATNLRVTYSGKLRNDSSDDGSDDEDDDDDDENNGDNKVTDDAVVNPVYANLDQIEMQPPKGKSFVVRHMRVLKWMNDRAFPADMSMLLSLYSETVKCQQKNPNGCVIFHCLYGAERSGLCCAMMNMMDQLEADHEVNVYDSVKRVRQAQPKFVKTIDDYQYLYQLALHHQTLAESGNNHVHNSVLYSNINDM